MITQAQQAQVQVQDVQEVSLEQVQKAWPADRAMNTIQALRMQRLFNEQGRNPALLRDWLRIKLPTPSFGFGRDLRAEERGETTLDTDLRWCLAVLTAE